MASDRSQRRVERLLDEADEAVAQLDWETVRARAQAVLAFDPHNGDAAELLAAADRAAGEAVAPSSVELKPGRVHTDPRSREFSQPTSFANGRYQVKEFLGEGGKKRVYRAHDSVLDRDVALAVIKTEGLDPTSRVRITREAQAMGRLGDHPHVLSIHDLGEDNGQPYMVLPLMPGGDVGTLLEKAEDHRLPLEQAIDLAAQVCRGLEFAHSKDIVHRDLKPGNIWLTSDGIAKIGDFGLAVAIDRSRLTQEGMMVGTVSYMPPEQAMGGEVTPQSDLYSLGAMLYEMVTGRPPFLGDDSVAIIGQHINTPAVAPTWHNAQCPRALEALIMRLLAKNPGERPDSATDVIAALEGIDLTLPAADEAPERDQAHALDSLAGGVFVGRQREMGELKAALEDALSGRGRLVTLVGEPGIGKTRTSEELATYAGLRGCQVLWGRCHESRGAPPYWPWVQAIRSYVRERDPEHLRSEMGTGAADIAEIVSDVRERIPDLKPSPAVDDPEQARFRLFDSITAFLKTASRSQPLVVILDNLHWADKPSLLLLEFLAQEFSDSRLLVIGTYRDVDLSRQHPLVETLGELTRERLFQRVLLRGLSRDDVGRFIEITSGITPPRGLVRAVHTQTEGNPLFVTEVVRLLVQEGELTQERTEDRESWEVRIPEGVREVIGRRLNRLSARCNETLTIASVIGRDFDLRQLAPLLEDLSEDRLLEVLEEALSARVIEEIPQAVGRYQFTHALILQTLSDELTTTRRVRLNARILETLEELYEHNLEANSVALAHHATEAEAMIGSEKLVRYSILAGERALATYAHEEALSHFERALATKEGQAVDGEFAAILFGLGRAQAATLERHELQKAVDSLSRAMDYYAAKEEIHRVESLGQVWVKPIAGVTRTAEFLKRALALIPSDSGQASRFWLRYGESLGTEEGDYEGALHAFDRADEASHSGGEVDLRMEILAASGQVSAHHLRYEDALEKCEQALELAVALDMPDAKAQAHTWSSVALAVLGEPERADLHNALLLEVVERLRDKGGQEMAFHVSEEVALFRGDWQAAKEWNERTLAVVPNSAMAVGMRAVTAYECGDFGQGETYLQRLVELMDVVAPGPNHWYVRPSVVIPRVARITGDTDRLDIARRTAEVVLSSRLASPARTTPVRTGLALIAVIEGDVALAAEQYPSLQAQAGKMLFHSELSADHVLGLLAHTMGNLDDAQTHFEDGLAFCRKAGYRPELAWTCCDYADMLLERDAEGNRDRVVALLDESLAISSELGMRPLMERVLSRKMSLQGIDVSSPQTSIDAVVSAVEVERPDLQPHAAPDGTVTIMFTDIEGSTAMTERLGDQKAQDVLRIHNAIIREQVGANEGFEVKSQGDGFMLAFSSARRALECAIAIQQNFAIHEEAHPGEPIRVRIGLHTGEAIKEGEDFFGKTVILAARIACEASGGQILVSSLLKALVESSGEFAFGDGREMELKGLAGTHQVFGVNLPT